MTPSLTRPVASARSRALARADCLALMALASILVPGPLGAQVVAEVQMTPETMTLGVGQRQTLFATAFDRQGNLIPNARFTFWSSDTLIARVTREGTVVGMSPGLAKVEARIRGRRGSMAVLITGRPGRDTTRAVVPPGTVLTLEPSTIRLLPGESVPATVQARREEGSIVDPGRVTWRSLRPEVAEVDSAGLVIGVGPGRSILQATTSLGLSATAAVEVEPADFGLSRTRLLLGPEEADTVRAIVPSQGNRQVRGGILWQSSDTGVARVGPTGIVVGVRPGPAEIIATGFAQERRIPITVYRAPQALTVTPRPSDGPVQLPRRGVRRITAVAEAADSTPIPEARINWQVGDTALIRFDPAKGEVTGKALGTTNLTVRLYGFDPVTWTVEVIPGFVGLDRQRVGLRVGERLTIGANLVDDDRKVVGEATGLVWNSNQPDVARVSPGGVIDGLRPGRATVTATAPWGKSDSAVVFVLNDLVVASSQGGRAGIYQFGVSGHDTLMPLLSDTFSNVHPALSPDRTRIAFSSNRGGSYDLYVMDADGGNPKRITTDPGNEGEPAWTPDGSRIVYTATPPEGPTQLYVVPAAGGATLPLTSTSGGNRSPAVSPDGKSIAFVSSRDGNQELYLMPLDGGEARRLTTTNVRESLPRFLREGELICVVERGRSKGSRVLRLPPAGEPVPLQETEDPIVSLGVSRDGKRFAYVVGRLAARKGKSQYGLFVQSLAVGSSPTQVPTRAGEQILSVSF